MANSISIDRMAVHYVDSKAKKIELSANEQDVSNLDATVNEFLVGLIEEVWDALEQGSISSANFSGSSNATVTDSVKKIIDDPNEIYDSSVKIARHLYAVSPTTASPGLLAVFRIVQGNRGPAKIAILKIQKSDERRIALDRMELTKITVEDIPNLLLEKIQKGAVLPHPAKLAYDLKLIDRQVKGEAKYFREDFLGCEVKTNDEKQSKELLRELRKFSEKKDLPFRREKLPRLVKGLIDEKKDVTTAFVISKVNQLKVFDQDLDADEFEKFLDRPTGLGAIDIPRAKFLRGKVREDRRVTFSFNVPPYRGIQIKGPIDVVQDIFTVEGNAITFTIRTSTDGYDVDWE